MIQGLEGFQESSTDPYARWCDRESPRGHTYVDFPIEIRTLLRIISLKCVDFLVLTGIAGLGSIWFEESPKTAYNGPPT